MSIHSYLVGEKHKNHNMLCFLAKNEVTKVTTQVLQKLELEQDYSKAMCPACGSTNVYGMSRVVGYFSKINNWNASKKAELKSRQKGDYRI